MAIIGLNVEHILD